MKVNRYHAEVIDVYYLAAGQDKTGLFGAGSITLRCKDLHVRLPVSCKDRGQCHTVIQGSEFYVNWDGWLPECEDCSLACIVLGVCDKGYNNLPYALMLMLIRSGTKGNIYERVGVAYGEYLGDTTFKGFETKVIEII